MIVLLLQVKSISIQIHLKICQIITIFLNRILQKRKMLIRTIHQLLQLMTVHAKDKYQMKDYLEISFLQRKSRRDLIIFIEAAMKQVMTC